MILAELGIETIAGGGVTGMLVVVMTAMLRRTKDTDVRRDEITSMVINSADDREARAWAERDKALAERDQAREEVARLRGLLEERIKWTNETTRTRDPGTPPPKSPSP
jgi:hypothetical protein